MSSETSGEVFLIRHGETAWSLSGQHTSRTDLPLTEEGRRSAIALGQRLAGRDFALVLSSPMQRALETCRLTGYQAEIEPNLNEWNYGAYEGLTSADIHKTSPGWTIWTGTPPGGESADQVGDRADRVIERALGAIAREEGDVALFAHGHMLRVLAARWLELPPDSGRLFALDTASLSVLGWERETRVIRMWNQAGC
jgi:broad specificity phosphatase PhoE